MREYVKLVLTTRFCSAATSRNALPASRPRFMASAILSICVRKAVSAASAIAALRASCSTSSKGRTCAGTLVTRPMT